MLTVQQEGPRAAQLKDQAEEEGLSETMVSESKSAQAAPAPTTPETRGGRRSQRSTASLCFR